MESNLVLRIENLLSMEIIHETANSFTDYDMQFLVNELVFGAFDGVWCVHLSPSDRKQ